VQIVYPGVAISVKCIDNTLSSINGTLNFHPTSASTSVIFCL
jgi:hypothetical protein